MDTLHRHPNGWIGKEPWWKSAVFYQVYPASFKDSNNDGWGDIPGLISKIDYLHQLGVDVVWLSPMFESPQKDMGYDISNYQAVYPRYGTLSDVDTLIHACHSRGMKLILDLVVNHTSSLHPWFLESRSSKTNPKRNWYIWKPPRFDSSGLRIPPTNWRSYFAGPTWTWDPHTQEYYLHLYDTSQPDLNWENPACREEIYSHTMIFWLSRGIDGFRIDTVNKYSKNTAFPDAPITIPDSPTQPAPEMWCNGPRIHDFLREMNTRVLTPYRAVSVGELSNTPLPSQVLPYVSASSNQLSMVFEFSTIRLGTGNLFSGKYTYHHFPLSTLKSHISTWQTFIEGTDAWHTVFIENHDNGRAVSRFGDTSTPHLWELSAKTIALWQVTLTGTLFLYQGQEIGMTNMPNTWGIDEYKDVESKGFYDEAVASGDEEKVKSTMHGLGILARDHSRLPFQWDGEGRFAGFMEDSLSSDDNSTSIEDGNLKEEREAKPWMRVHDDYKTINAKTQMDDDESVLGYYKKMLKLRKEFADLFIFGSFRLLIPGDENIFAYVKESVEDTNTGVTNRQAEKRRALVVMNFTREEHGIGLDIGEALGCGHDNRSEVRFLVGTYGDAENLKVANGLMMPLRPWEGRVYVNFGVQLDQAN